MYCNILVQVCNSLAKLKMSTVYKCMMLYCCCSSSDNIGVGFEQEAYVGTVYENSGSVSVCVISNVTLNGSRTAAAILQTQDVSAHG